MSFTSHAQRLRLAALAIIVCASVQVRLQAAPSPATARAAIAAAYARMDAGADKRDAEAATLYCTPTFTDVQKDGQVLALEDYRANISRMFSLATRVTSKTHITGFSLKGSKATVTVKQAGTLAIPDPSTHKPVKMVVTETESDLWMSTSSGWREQKITTLDTQMLVNGKAVPAG